MIFGHKTEYPFKLYLICTLLSQSFSIATPQALSCFNNSLPYRVQNTRLMSHHAPCGNLLMLLTCLSGSPSRCLFFLYSSHLSLFWFTPDTPSQVKGAAHTAVPVFPLHLRTREWMSEGWGHLSGRTLTVPLSLWCWSFIAPQTHSVPTRPACFR